jgi:hypothetical protein
LVTGFDPRLGRGSAERETELETYVGRPRTEATEGEKIFCLNHP